MSGREEIAAGKDGAAVKKWLVALLLLGVGTGIWLACWPLAQRLDVGVTAPLPLVSTWAGQHRVDFPLIPAPDARDKGRVTIQIRVDGRVLREVESFYNYDLWQNDPAGWFYRSWFNGDVRLETLEGAWLIHGRDGSVEDVPLVRP